MSFNTNPGRNEFTASAAQTVFTFNFKIFATTDIKVYLTPSGQTADDTADLLTITTEYTVVIDGDNGGTITLITPASANDSVTIIRDLPIARPIEYQTLGDLLAGTLNIDQDYQTYLIGDRNEDQSRFLKIPDSAQNISNILPSPKPLYSFRWNSSSNALEEVLISEESIILNSVDTMSDLLVTSISVGTVNLRGYYTREDGGGGIFNYDTAKDKSTANGGTVIDPSVPLANQGTGAGLGCWVRYVSGPHSIKWFGAKGDGVNDDTAAIQATIDDATNIYCPEGIYLISGRLNLINGQTFKGASITGTKFLVDYIQFMRIGDGENYSRSIVQDFTMLANQVPTDPTSYGILHEITNFSPLRNSILIQNIVVRGSDGVIQSTLGFKVNFKFSNSYGPEINYTRVEGTFLVNNDPSTQTDTYGIVIADQTVGTLINHCNYNAVKEGITVTASTAEGIYVDNCEMVGCRVGFSAASTLGVNITNSHFNTSKYGYIASSSNVHLISNTSFYSTAAFFNEGDYFGISANTVTKLMLSNVYIQDQDAATNTNKCIYLVTCASVQMNNIVTSGQGYGIYIDSNCTGVNMDAITFDAVDTAYFVVSDGTCLDLKLGNHTFTGSVLTKYNMQNRTHLTVKENSLRINGLLGNATVSTTTNITLTPNESSQFQVFSLSATGSAYQLNITLAQGTGKIAGAFFEFELNLPSQVTATVVFLDKNLATLHIVGTATAGKYYAKAVYDGTGIARITALHQVIPTL